MQFLNHFMEKGDIMKSLKKYLLIIAAALLTITLSACGTKITAEEAINKSAEVSKNVKSTEFKSFLSTEYITGKDPKKVEANISGVAINEPFSLHASIETKAEKTTLSDLYIKDKVIYKKAGSNPWIKELYSTYKFERYQFAKTENRMEFYKKIAKEFKLTEENGNYVLTYSGSGNQFSDFTPSLVETSAFQINPYSIKDVEFKSVNIKFVVSKDFMPISNEVTMEVVSKIIPKAKTMKLVQNITYSNVNKATNINLPEEVKNAKDKYDTKL